MFDLNDYEDLKAFKKMLSDMRKEKGFTQDAFAKDLHDNDRSRVANWESQKSPTIPRLADFVTICNILDVDPNYLLGKTNIDSSDDYAISNAIGLSYSNIKQLRYKNYNNRIVDFFLSSPISTEMMKRLKQICYYEFISEAMETTFSTETLKKIDKAYHKFYQETFPLDMSVGEYEKYISREMPWKIENISIDDFIHASISDNEYNNILYDCPTFESLSDSEKYDILIHDIAETSYDYKLKHSIIELSRNEITKYLGNIVDDFIKTEVSNFQNINIKPQS